MTPLTGVPIGALRELLEVDAVRQRQPPGRGAQDRVALGGGREAAVDQAVQAPGAQQRRIQQVRPRCRADHAHA